MHWLNSNIKTTFTNVSHENLITNWSSISNIYEPSNLTDLSLTLLQSNISWLDGVLIVISNRPMALRLRLWLWRHRSPVPGLWWAGPALCWPLVIESPPCQALSENFHDLNNKERAAVTTRDGNSLPLSQLIMEIERKSQLECSPTSVS